MRGQLSLYLVDRGPGYGKDFHPSLTPHRVIVCTARHTAKWEAGASDTPSWIWERDTAADDGEGFLLVRWNGLDIDYGTVVRGIKLPDGTTAGFCHPGNRSQQHQRPWKALRGAVWWSEHPLPAWLRDKWGVVEATDEFTIDRIEEDSGLCLLPYSQQQKWQQRRQLRAGGGA